jgi:hypothetical protein
LLGWAITFFQPPLFFSYYYWISITYRSLTLPHIIDDASTLIAFFLFPFLTTDPHYHTPRPSSADLSFV